MIAGSTTAIAGIAIPEVDFANCDCCGLTEECTPPYIQSVRDRFGGKWICGLCAEAVKDEVVRCGPKGLTPDEAMARHLRFCNEVRGSGRQPAGVDLIRAMSRALRRGLEGSRSMPGSPSAGARVGLSGSERWIPSLTLVEGKGKG